MLFGVFVTAPVSFFAYLLTNLVDVGGKGGGLFLGCGTGLTWVGGDEEGAVEAENGRIWVDEDGFLFAGPGIEEFEEWGEAWFAEVEALVIG